MILLLASAASAADLELMFANAYANGTLDVGWYVSDQGMAVIMGLRQGQNAVLKLRVSANLNGRAMTQTVTLSDRVGKTDLGGKGWPRGTQVQLSLVDPTGTLEGLSVNGVRGSVYTFVALGGTQASSPGPSPSPRPYPSPKPSPAPAPSPAPHSTSSSTTTTTTSVQSHASVDIGTVDPMAVFDAATQIAQQMQNQQAQGGGASVVSGDPYARPQGPTAADVALDPNDPRTVACTSLVPMKKIPSCIATISPRANGIAEAEQCKSFGPAGLKIECLGVIKRARVAVDATIASCVQVFGSEVEALRCLNVAADAETPPAQDIVDCGAALDDPIEQMQCMKRFSTLTWSPSLVIAPCQEHFSEDPMLCMHKVSAGADAPIPALIPACAKAFSGDAERASECLGLMHRRAKGDAAASVGACQALFGESKQRLECVVLARRDPDPIRIAACSTQEKPKKRLSCVEGP